MSATAVAVLVTEAEARAAEAALNLAQYAPASQHAAHLAEPLASLNRKTRAAWPYLR